jgi:predicted dehydrogenase
MENKKFNVAIIGAGSIGALKDEKLDNPKTFKPLTHAHAVFNDERFHLSTIIDKDEDKAILASARWNCYYSKDIMPPSMDVLVIAANTKNHFNILMNDIINLNKLPKLVIVEKPFCWTIGEAAIVKRFYEEQGIKLLVNYSRRYSKAYQKFYDEYIKNQEVQQVIIRYNRGLKHDGCHALDIINWWFGRCLDISLNKSIDPILDYPEGGRSYSVSMKYEFCPSVVFIPMDYKKCGIFEMDIITKKNRHIFGNYGEYIINMEITENKTYGQANSFSWNVEEMDNPISILDPISSKKRFITHSAFQTDLHYTLKNLYDKVYECLTSSKQVDNICTVDDAIRVHNIVEHVDMLYDKQTW